MENVYDDTLLPENFEQIAQAYSKSLKNKGFVFVRLEEEEFNLLVSETLVLTEKMLACLKSLKKVLDAKVLHDRLEDCRKKIADTFHQNYPQKFRYLGDSNSAFLTLVALENLLIIKLMLLSVKSGELELCNTFITSISSVFAEIYSCENFKTEN